MLDDRRRNVLTALVREYIRSAHPVGSKSLVDHYGLGCSPATVRNDLSALEEDGYVYQPHVSAGRVPTDVGYRTFVDDIHDSASDVASEEIESVRSRLREVEAGLADLMRETASLLTRLTSYAAVVLAPTLKQSRVRRIDLVPLAADRVLIVLITDTGQVAKGLAELDESVHEAEIAQVEVAFNRVLSGQVADGLRETMADLAHQTTCADVWLTLIDGVFALLMETDETSVYHLGTAALLGEPEFEDPEMVRSIVGLLEDSLALVRTFSEVGRTEDVLVRIGAENALAELGQMSVVLAPYGGPWMVGYLGLLGPTRMDYARAITSVRCIADTLTETIAARSR